MKRNNRIKALISCILLFVFVQMGMVKFVHAFSVGCHHVCATNTEKSSQKHDDANCLICNFVIDVFENIPPFAFNCFQPTLNPDFGALIPQICFYSVSQVIFLRAPPAFF